MDIGDRILAPDGRLPEEVMPDALHPSAVGYQIWADAIRDTVQDLLHTP
jgi:beta-glucosidase